MNIDLNRIQGQLRLLQSIVERAQTVIKSSQSRAFPYQGLNDTQRIFCAILAAQARDLANSGAKQFGVTLCQYDPETLSAAVTKFFSDSADHVGTDPVCMEGARMAAGDALIKTASELVARSERVLEHDETIGGQRLVKGPLWDK
ncbi:MAG: hypothetical protein K8F91_03875 [Candidatus Obscuribacterales bacterium]|nr:hypothetical protein [Candidatus Obscuribacterales bacterium]